MSDPAPWEEYECEACDIKQTQKTIEDVDNEEAQEIDYCEQCDFKCLECPCRWKLVEDSLVETAIQEFGAAIDYPDGRNPNASVSTSTVRKRCYRAYSAISRGFMGKGNRVKPPSCVQAGLGERFPNPAGKARVGFHKT